MLKIPELPIYNTERYARYSPISPDDIDAGQIYTNDSLFVYISHLSFNKTAGYRVWNKDGEYVGTDVYSSHNIYAIATYLNKNDFRPLDYDMEVVNPFDTDKRYLLTPDGIKKVDDGLTEGALRRIVEKSVRRALMESDYGDIGWQRHQSFVEKNRKLLEFLKKNVADENTRLCLSRYDSRVLVCQYIDDDKYIDGSSLGANNKPYLGYDNYKVKIRGAEGWDYGFVDREELRARYPQACEKFDECEKYILQSLNS